MMKFDPAKAIPDLDGKVAVVTGSTSGIGFAVAQVLVRRGAKVYLAARNEEKAKICLKRIEDEGHEKGQALWHHLDLADPAFAKKSAEEFLLKEKRLDILVNNAAAIIVDYKIDTRGFQEVITVNHFSPFVFTNTLLPLMKKTTGLPSSDVRIVNVASDAYKFVTVKQFKTKDDFNTSYGASWWAYMKRYGLSKLTNILWTKELQRRLTEEGSDIICIAVHPGSVFTDGGVATAQRFPAFIRVPLTVFGRMVMLSPLQGAGTPCIAAAAPIVRQENDKYKGCYLTPMGKITSPGGSAKGQDLAKELWLTTETMLNEMDI